VRNRLNNTVGKRENRSTEKIETPKLNKSGKGHVPSGIPLYWAAGLMTLKYHGSKGFSYAREEGATEVIACQDQKEGKTFQ